MSLKNISIAIDYLTTWHPYNQVHSLKLSVPLVLDGAIMPMFHIHLTKIQNELCITFYFIPAYSDGKSE